MTDPLAAFRAHLDADEARLAFQLARRTRIARETQDREVWLLREVEAARRVDDELLDRALGEAAGILAYRRPEEGRALAEELLSRPSAEGAGHAWAHVALARCADDPDAAVGRLQQALELAPDTVVVLVEQASRDLAAALLRAGRPEEALPHAERCLAMARAKDSIVLSLALTGVGAVHRARGAPAAALPFYREAYAIEPEGDAMRPIAGYFLAGLLRELGELDEAVAILEAGTGQAFEVALRVRCLRELGRDSEADAVLTEARASADPETRDRIDALLAEL